MSKDKTVIRSLQKPDGAWTDIGLESLESDGDSSTTQYQTPDSSNQQPSWQEVGKEIEDLRI